MTNNEYEVIKHSGCQNFTQLLDKDFNLTQDKKITITTKAALPVNKTGHVDIKETFSLFKPNENFISPILAIEQDNRFKIKYNLLKNSASINTNFISDSSWIKAINYQIIPDKTNNKLLSNKLDFIFKHNIQVSFNQEQNEAFIHVSHQVNSLGTFKWKLNNKDKTMFKFNMNYSWWSYLSYFNCVELNWRNMLFKKNIHGWALGYSVNPDFSFNMIGGIGINVNNERNFKDRGKGGYDNEILGNKSIAVYSKNTLGNGLKIENGVALNLNKTWKEGMNYIWGWNYKNWVNGKVKITMGEVRSCFNLQYQMMKIKVNWIYGYGVVGSGGNEKPGNVKDGKDGKVRNYQGIGKGGFKYGIAIELKI